jgi:hypothetical protein
MKLKQEQIQLERDRLAAEQRKWAMEMEMRQAELRAVMEFRQKELELKSDEIKTQLAMVQESQLANTTKLAQLQMISAGMVNQTSMYGPPHLGTAMFGVPGNRFPEVRGTPMYEDIPAPVPRPPPRPKQAAGPWTQPQATSHDHSATQASTTAPSHRDPPIFEIPPISTQDIDNMDTQVEIDGK